MALENSKLVASAQETLVLQTLRDHSERLIEISSEIWKNPELSFEEFKAVALLTNYLEEQGFRVIRSFCGIETSFLAEYQTTDFNPKRDPTVAVLCKRKFYSEDVLLKKTRNIKYANSK